MLLNQPQSKLVQLAHKDDARLTGRPTTGMLKLSAYYLRQCYKRLYLYVTIKTNLKCPNKLPPSQQSQPIQLGKEN